MPALQVRDFPQDVYDRLAAQAKIEHRSIAQQTVASVERDLNRAKEGGAEILVMPSRTNKMNVTSESVEERIVRRKKLFKDIDRHNIEYPWPDNSTPAVEMVRMAREDAYARLGR